MTHLGKTLQDKITGFKGIAIGHCTYLTGCNQYGLAPPVSSEGKILDTQWFDETRLNVIDNGITKEEVTGVINGGPNRDMPR